MIEVRELPQLVVPIATLTRGWPDGEPQLSDRLPLASFVHHETYRDCAPELIDEFYGYKESLPENKHFVEINHKETLAQVFTDLRYTRRDNEALSQHLLATLRRQGFLQNEG